MHLGAFDDEIATVELMNKFIAENGYENDFSDTNLIDKTGGVLKNRLHHEIYLSDVRKIAQEKWKTVIRHPVKRI